MSDPVHAKYGKHLSSDEINDLIKPHDESLDLVHDWLLDHGIQASNLQYTPAKDWIKIQLSTAEVEELLETEYSTYVRDDGLQAVRTPKWSLPIHLHEHITTIQPTNSFFGPRKAAPLEKRMSQLIAEPALTEDELPSMPDAGTLEEVCNVDLVTPTCVRTLYGTINYTVQAGDKNTMGFTNYLGEVVSRSDAYKMLQRFRPEAAQAAYEFGKISIAGGPIDDELSAELAEAGTGLEGGLDVQAMLSIGWPTPLITWSTGGQPPFMPDLFTPENTNEPYLTFLDYILSQPDPLPSVISTSYDDDEQTVPKDYAIETCKRLAQLGARGVTVLFASGDSGIGQDAVCFTNDGKNTSTFLPNFPSTCPYVTSVGGTYKVNPEVAVYRARPGRPVYTAGGGFSYYFKRPKYQDDAVPAYVKNIVDPLGYDGLYDPEGRGYPDIAGQALNYSTYYNGSLLPISGTSMSTPLIGAIMALVNDALVAKGKPTLGFLNVSTLLVYLFDYHTDSRQPWVYSSGKAAFNDILSGSAAGCSTSQGLPAAEGWDAVTGYGTPNFGEILALLGAEPEGWSDWKR